MLTHFTIKAKFILLTGLLCLSVIVIGMQGVTSLDASNKSIQSLYEDRVSALASLNTVLDMMQQNQMAVTAAALSQDPEQIKGVVGAIGARRAVIDKEWKTFASTHLTPEQKKLAERYEQDRRRFLEQGIEPAIAALQAGDMESAAELARGQLQSHYEPVRKVMEELVRSELDASKEAFDQSQARHATSTAVIIAASVLALLAGISMSWWIISVIMAGMKDATRIAETISAGDFSQEFESNRRDEFGTLINSLGEMEDKLTDLVTNIKQSSDTIQIASSEIASGNLDLSSRTEQQAASIEETASTMEQLTQTVQQNADSAMQATRLAAEAAGIAQQGGAVVSEVVSTMGDIRTSSQKIVEIISVIDGIAFQTNILALNAAVEAARAGEQGRGFAVVATEVRGLAQRSAGAAKEIKSLIESSVDKVDAGSRLVDQAGKTMEKIVTSVKKVSDMMHEIELASAEQSNGIIQVNQAVSEMDKTTQQNAALVEQASAAAQTLRDQAAELAKVVNDFKL